jgi:hypothetical protein
MFAHDSRPRLRSRQKSPLAEGPCTPHSRSVAFAISLGVTHGPYAVTTEKRSEGRQRDLRISVDHAKAASGRKLPVSSQKALSQAGGVADVKNHDFRVQELRIRAGYRCRPDCFLTERKFALPLFGN